MTHTTSRLSFSRDPFGVRPFYYARLRGSASVPPDVAERRRGAAVPPGDARRCPSAGTATEASASQERGHEVLFYSERLDEVLAHPGVSSRLHEPAIADFLLFGFNQDPDATTFADVRSLAPGHSLVFENGEVRTRCDWTLPIEEVRFRRPEEYCERFRELLGQAVGERLEGAGERAAILMSGGLDSTSIAAMSAGRGPASPGAKLGPPCPRGATGDAGPRRVLRAYTIAYDSLIANEERRYAGAVAARLGLPIEFLAADGYRLFDKWDDPRYHTPEPHDNPLWAVPVDLFRRIAADGCRVVLSGEAGDAAAAPVQALPELLFVRLKPDSAKNHLMPLARDIVRFQREHGKWPPFGIAAWWRRKVRGPMADREPRANLAILDKAFAKRVGAEERCRAHPDEGWAHYELQSTMWPWCAVTQTPAWTGVDVEVRYPFLDVRLVSFMLSVPSVPWAYDKELMRTAMRGLLPDEVLRRRKAPLTDDPVAALMRRDGPPPMPDRKSPVWEFVDRAEYEKVYASGAARAREITRVICLDKWFQQQAAGSRRQAAGASSAPRR